jgi:hypothetical protein
MFVPTPSALSLRLQGFRSTADEPAEQRVDSAARRLRDIQAHTLGSSQSLIAQLEIRDLCDLCFLHRDKQLASDPIRSQGFVWKSRPVRHPNRNRKRVLLESVFDSVCERDCDYVLVLVVVLVSVWVWFEFLLGRAAAAAPR